MISLLDRAGVHKPDHLTPLEFSQTLSFLPSESYDTIVRMTEIFYRVGSVARSFQKASAAAWSDWPNALTCHEAICVDG